MTMRIGFVVLVFVVGACSPGGHSAGRPKGPPAGRTAVPAPVTTTPSTGSPPAAEPPPDAAAPVRPEAHRVTFAIRGSVRRSSVSYTTPDGRKRHLVVSPPWSRTFSVNDGQSIDVRAHSTGAGQLTCTLNVDGDLVKSATSSGDSATVDCGDSLGF
jgi:hypothetical protein